jgi:hypothetical protein
MKQTLTTYQVADALKKDENGGWSWNGSLALAEYLEQMEEDLGQELELDVVAIRCDYSEHESLVDWAKGYFGDNWKEQMDIDEADDPEEVDGEIRGYVKDHGDLIEFEGGVIVSSF